MRDDAGYCAANNSAVGQVQISLFSTINIALTSLTVAVRSDESIQNHRPPRSLPAVKHVRPDRYGDDSENRPEIIRIVWGV